MNEITPFQNAPQNLTIDRTGIEFIDDITFEDWRQLGEQLIPMAKSIGFIVGDWINYGAGRYKEVFDDAIVATGLALETVRQYSYVARKIKKGDRSQILDWSHHLVLAKVKNPHELRDWIARAEDKKLSVSALRKAINTGKIPEDNAPAAEPATGADEGTVTYLALINRLRRWFAQETEKTPLSRWDQERREAIKADLAPLVEIHNKL
jgi:hypothetical protein